MKSTSFKLRAVQQISGETYFVCQLLDEKMEAINFLKSNTAGLRWQVHLAPFPQTKSWKEGIRTFCVRPLQSDAHVSVGEILIGES